jgi:hypothetical protein
MILLIILAIFGFVVIVGVGLTIWKRYSDIKQIKENVEKLYSVTCTKNAKDYANCYVDEMVSEYGWLGVKKMNNDDWKLNSDEEKFSKKSENTCKEKYC